MAAIKFCIFLSLSVPLSLSLSLSLTIFGNHCIMNSNFGYANNMYNSHSYICMYVLMNLFSFINAKKIQENCFVFNGRLVVSIVFVHVY